MKKLKNNKVLLGTFLVGTIIMLLIVGVVVISSITYPKAIIEAHGNPYFYVKKHVFWIIVGTIAFLLGALFDYRNYNVKITFMLYVLGVIFLFLVLIIGVKVNGARRWLQLIGGVRVQPSEFVKIIFILMISKMVTNFKKLKFKDREIFGQMVFFSGIYIILILLSTALTNATQIAIIFLTMLILSGIKMRYIISSAIVLTVTGGLAIIMFDFRFKRILNLLTGYQGEQGLLAVGSGGFFGRGYGNGLQKYFYLPEIHTDFIFAGYLEEFGFLGGIFLIVLYASLLLVIIFTIGQVKDMYAKYILSGIFIMLATQIVGNMAISLRLMPSTGLPLPLISYGGSSLTTVMLSLGIVMNIIRSIENENDKLDT